LARNGPVGQSEQVTYTGDVHPGGPSDVRELDTLTITKISVGPMDNNAYLLRSPATGDAVLIDAANEPDRLLDLVRDIPLRAIVTTHRHGDHWQALAAVHEATGAQVVAHTLDAPELPVDVDRTVEDGDTVPVGDSTLSVIHLRGHTPGSIALRFDEPGAHPHVFTGDSLFPGGVGNTWKDPARFEQLIGDVESKIFERLPDATWVYPGHGNDTTLGAERPHLAEWHARGW
jgi:glyoxylase-like metal-dependent hydrolase (beta-lactamase superfamily II)